MRSKKYIRLLHHSIIILIAMSGLSFQWPLEESIVTSTFGESRWDHYHDGMDIVSMKNQVCSMGDGNIAYFWDKSIFPLDKYPGGGNYMVLEHRTDLYSVYMHLDDGLKIRKHFKAGDIIGTSGNTGHSFARHLHFSLLNIVKKSSYNPLMYLSKIDDEKKPQIMELMIRIGDRYTVIRENGDIRLTKHYPLLVNIRDSIKGRENVGIYKLSVSHNDRSVLNVKFAEISYSKKGLTILNKTYDDLYDVKGYYKINDIRYIDGLNKVTVTASDYNGNEFIKEFQFNVKLDMELN